MNGYAQLRTAMRGYVRPCMTVHRWYGCVRLCRFYVRLYTAVYGYAWFCSAMLGYAQLCKAMHGYVRPCMALHGTVRLFKAM